MDTDNVIARITSGRHIGMFWQLYSGNVIERIAKTRKTNEDVWSNTLPSLRRQGLFPVDTLPSFRRPGLFPVDTTRTTQTQDPHLRFNARLPG